MTLEEMVRDEVHDMLDKNMWYEMAEDKSAYVDRHIDEMPQHELLALISAAIERIRE